MIDSHLDRPTRHRLVVAALRQHGPLHPAQIGEQLGLCVKRARLVVCELRRQGVIRPIPVTAKRRVGGQVTYYEVSTDQQRSM